MIEDIKELNPELSVVALFERKVLEYREIHVLEAQVAKEVTAHGAEGSRRGWKQNRVSGHVAATLRKRTGVGGDRRTLLIKCRGELSYDAAHPGCLRATKTGLRIDEAEGNGGRAAGLEVGRVAEEIPAI